MDFDNLSSDAALQKFHRLLRKFIMYLSANMCRSSLTSSLFIMSKRVYSAARSKSFNSEEHVLSLFNVFRNIYVPHVISNEKKYI